MPRLVEVLTLLLLLAASALAQWSDSTASVFSQVANFRVASLADWNGDKKVDLVGVNTITNQVNIYLWSSENSSFYLAAPLPPVDPQTPTDATVSVVVADINRDGWLDIAVQRITTGVYLYNGATQQFSHFDGIDNFNLTMPQLSVLDVYGDCALLDIVVAQQQPNGDETVTMTVFENTLPHSDCSYVGGSGWNFTGRPLPSHGSDAVPMTVLTADIDGDCSADVIYALVENATHISYFALVGASRDGSTLTFLFSVPASVGVPTALDANGDGAVDFAFPARSGQGDHGEHSHFNAGPASGAFDSILFVLSDLDGSNPCNGDDCCGGHPSSYPASELLRLSEVMCPTQSAVTFLDTPLFPAMVRAQDYNRDSYTDLLFASNVGPMILTKSGGGSPLQSLYSCAPLDASRLNDQDYLSSVPFFFDIDEDGTLDLLTTPQDGVSTPRAYQNNFDAPDNYFFIAFTLNGVKGGGVAYPSWAAGQVGAVHRFQWQDIDTNLRFGSGTQQGATQAQALLMPRVHFGLGRTFSYIQNYATGMHMNGSPNTNHQWSSYLIPNSQVVCLPYPVTDPDNWEIQLFISPLRYQQLLIISMLTALSVIGVPIVLLKWREMQEDKLEMRR